MTPQLPWDPSGPLMEAVACPAAPLGVHSAVGLGSCAKGWQSAAQLESYFGNHLTSAYPQVARSAAHQF